MRLLNTKSLQLEFFAGNDTPQYVILSHTWGQEEVSLDDFSRNSNLTQLKGWEKIRRGCEIAESLKFDYIWIDTCCIDKASSAELSEAINSMFRWYEEAQLCIAFLADVEAAVDAEMRDSQLQESRWFTRGWTLQELIAPSEVYFYGKEWTQIGTRDSLKVEMRMITGVPEEILETQPAATTRRRRRKLDGFSVAQRMSWAAERVTTRAEDVAYCLLGIFDINMPLLYGEGQEKAFKRLQEEIIRSTDDESIYVWHCPKDTVNTQHYWGLLAESPADFGNDANMTPRRSKYLTRKSNHTTTTSNRGLRLELTVTPFPNDKSNSIFFAFLDCDMRWEGSSVSLTPAILLQRTSWDNDTDFVRIRPDVLALFMMNRIVMPDDLAIMMKGDDPHSMSSMIAEALPRQIFVPHDYTFSRSPRGIIFHPEVHDPQGSPIVLRVRSRSPTWQHFNILSKSGGHEELFEISFDVVPVPDVADLTEAKMFGVVEFGWETLPGRTGFSSPSNFMSEKVVCLVTGLEPLPPNPLGTPALYFAPWCAFESQAQINAGSFEGVLNKDSRQDHVGLDKRLHAALDLESRNSRMYYRVALDVSDVEASSKKNRLWF